MGFTFNGLSADIEISGIPGIPTANQVIISGRYTGTGGVTVLHTATAGYTAYLYGLTCTHSGTFSNSIFNHDSSQFVTLVGVTNTSEAYTPSVPFLSAIAGETIKGNCTNGSLTSYTIVEVLD